MTDNVPNVGKTGRIGRLLFCLSIAKHRSLQTLRELYEYGAVIPLSDGSKNQTELPPGFEELAAAIEGRSRVQMIYRGGTIRATMREVVPLQIIASGGRQYLSAVCGFDGRTKTFRLDRILKLQASP